MEIAIAVFLGLWLSGFALWGYLRLKKDYKEVLKDDEPSGKEGE